MSLLDRCLAIHQAKPVIRPPRPAPRLLKVRLSDEDRVTIVEEFRAGVATTRKLAQRYEVSDYAIRMLLRRAGIASRQPGTSAKQRRQVRKLWLEGASVAVIAKTVGVGQTTVRLVVADLVRSGI